MSTNSEPQARVPVVIARYRFAAVLGLVYLGLSSITRLALLLFHPDWLVTSTLAVVVSLLHGLAFDLLACGWWLLPWVLYLTLVPQRWFDSGWQRRLLVAGAGAIFFTWLFIATAEIFFFAEFDGRFNFVA
ncbi:MAG: hypothetical protein ABIV06_10085, partial [Thermoanaerobaculia bacterium]